MAGARILIGAALAHPILSIASVLLAIGVARSVVGVGIGGRRRPEGSPAIDSTAVQGGVRRSREDVAEGANRAFRRGQKERKAMLATALLKQQHKNVRLLFKKIEHTESGQTRRQLLEQIECALKGHTAIEEEIFYPAVRKLGTAKAEESVGEAFEEHHVVDLVLAELPDVDPTDDRFEAKMTVLSELVDHHAKEEEQEMFKLAQKFGRAQLAELGHRMEVRFNELTASRERVRRSA
jgi:hemerythrin superfamily protein